MTVLLKLTTAGSDSGPFDLYSNLDGYDTAFEENVSKVDLTAGSGYSTTVPDGATIVKIKSTGVCASFVDITLSTLNCSFNVSAEEVTAPVNSVEWFGDEYYGYGGDPGGGFYTLNGTVEIIGNPVTFRGFVSIPDNNGPGSFSTNIWVEAETPATERYVEVARSRDVNNEAYSTSFTLPAGVYNWEVDNNWFGTGGAGEGGIVWTQA